MKPTPPPYHLSADSPEISQREPEPPSYTEHADASPAPKDIETASLSSSLSASSSAYVPLEGPSLPAVMFVPLKQLQIQTPGKNLLSLPTPQRPDPIPIFTITAEGALGHPQYLSVRPDRRSGSCILTYGDDEARAPLTTTTYKWGPGRPPVVVLGDPAKNPAVGAEQVAEGEGREGQGQEQGIEIHSRSLFSRAVHFAVPGLGSFGWRYAGSKERVGTGADSLLVCEVFLPETPTGSGSGFNSKEYHDEKSSAGANADPKNPWERARRGVYRGKEGGEEVNVTTTPHRIAHFVRNETFRSPGTTRLTAGNGGRLQLDLQVFNEKVHERVEWLLVTTAITMLKREVDRRRTQQAAALAIIAS
ncbi:hypothetical protein F5Y14DRAFT_403015 [Nemania sp. NC0429]|nr:hypothetical protein F5Y14DRAFT_403015 [Nemania sp. NC0429]